jgi:hypothetical protein
METITLTRKELYDLIWTAPMSSMTKKYELSYSELRRICNDMCVPIPENGYWSKIHFGKPVLVEMLSEHYSGKDEITLAVRDVNIVSKADLQLSIGTSDEENSKSLFRVPDRLVNPDILITNTKDYYDAVKRYDWRSNTDYPSRTDVINIDVSHDKLPRALRIMNAIIKLLRSRGHEIKIKNGVTYAVIEEGDIEIKLKEKNRVSDVKTEYGSRQLESTGKFIFIIGDYHKKEVGDGIDLIETKLDIIIAKLEAEGKREKEERIASEERHKIWQEQQRIEKEIRERKEKELSDFKLLFIRATRLHQANILRSYISSIEAKAFKNDVLTDELRIWSDWAKQKVEWYDPLVNRKDETFNDQDKANIFRDFLKEWQ